MCSVWKSLRTFERKLIHKTVEKIKGVGYNSERYVIYADAGESGHRIKQKEK